MALEAICEWVAVVGKSIPYIERQNHLRIPDVRMVNWPAAIDAMMGGDWTITEAMIEPTVAGLDDIGAEHDPTRIGVEKLYRIFNERIGRWTVATTNIAPEQLEEKFERRLVSRFLRDSVIVDLSGVPDFNV